MNAVDINVSKGKSMVAILVCLTYSTDEIPQMSHSLLESNLSL